ncbi:hypothetical protein MRX96_034226 [Rhipicephalus microplus]
MLTGTYTLAGYTFKLPCELLKNEKKEVYTRFAFILRHGDWDDHVDWPFRKKVTLTIAHPRSRFPPFRIRVPGRANCAGRTLRSTATLATRPLYVNVQIE